MTTVSDPEELQLSLRIPMEWVHRADDLIPGVRKQQTELLAMGRISRSTVLRLAILRGLEALEKQTGTKPK